MSDAEAEMDVSQLNEVLGYGAMKRIEFSGKKIISGYRVGQKFRPSAWPEMLSDMAAEYNELHHLVYAAYLQPAYLEDYGHCVEVDFDAMCKDRDYVYEQVVEFIVSNRLEVFTIDGERVYYEVEGPSGAAA
ncbi:DUF3579 domain-containing protein [Acidihalobacter ferrooxydans]|uniref:Uncharacterized protein n=1 Tax=Acidihalobacter ferrooxydans TaxID=1765967 RepID=A0A1P8UFI8_9GAMM|nr:DUF3579 domain-containing protein [Acidihalobacter ferrooxydans]APZ42588.1 hypothetical protein BW247_05320 [Acidihalobacter ferrooxydans]